MNQTQLVKTAINAFIVVAVCISLFQELSYVNSKNSVIPSENNSNSTSTSTQQIPQQLTGPKIQGIKIYASDKFQSQIKQILAKNKYNVEIASYQFQGNQYWLNMIFNWGHMILIYVLINKYKTETNQDTKKKIMIGGAIAVMAWFYISGVAKPQKFSIEVEGRKELDRDYIDEKQIVDVLSVYELEFDDLNGSEGMNNDINPTIKAQETWPSGSKMNQNGQTSSQMQDEYQSEIEF